MPQRPSQRWSADGNGMALMRIIADVPMAAAGLRVAATHHQMQCKAADGGRLWPFACAPGFFRCLHAGRD